MAHQLNIFFLLFGALQGMLLSLFLLKNTRRSASNVALTLLLITVGLQLTFKVITKSWLVDNVNFFYNASYYLPYLAAPFFYLFIRVRGSGGALNTKDLIHLLPFIIGILHHAAVKIFGYSYWGSLPAFVIDGYTVMALQLISLASYSWLSWSSIQRNTSGSIRNGLLLFLWIFVVAETIIIITLTVMYKYYGSFPDVRLLFLTLTALIYWVSYKIVSQPDLFLPRDVAPVVAMKIESTPKYAHSGLKPEDADKIEASLRSAMQNEQLYLDSHLTIDSLASAMKISRHHLSQVLNERFSQTYTDYINSLRLEESRARFANPKFAHYTIAAIALDSGFNSVSNFNEAFKRRYGTTPSKFRNASAKKLSA